MLLTLIIIIEIPVFMTEEYCCKMEAPFRLVFWKAWTAINVVFYLSVIQLKFRVFTLLRFGEETLLLVIPRDVAL